ncbi:MAG TPA: NADH-quinone oxidoreductase subunit A [Armatimonadota bacterium]
MTQPPPITGFPAILALFLFAALLAGIFICVSVFLGPRRPSRAKGMPYESGMNPIGAARQQFPVHFYVVAMVFIIFDIETIFMYPWAILLRAHAGQFSLGRFGLVEMGIFMAILLVGYVYMLKKGAIEWD